jgi:hypothetical protein
MDVTAIDKALRHVGMLPEAGAAVLDWVKIQDRRISATAARRDDPKPSLCARGSTGVKGKDAFFEYTGTSKKQAPPQPIAQDAPSWRQTPLSLASAEWGWEDSRYGVEETTDWLDYGSDDSKHESPAPRAVASLTSFIPIQQKQGQSQREKKAVAGSAMSTKAIPSSAATASRTGKKAACPICGASYLLAEMDRHVDVCLALTAAQDEQFSKKEVDADNFTTIRAKDRGKKSTVAKAKAAAKVSSHADAGPKGACPICGLSYPLAEMDAHVDRCLTSNSAHTEGDRKSFESDASNDEAPGSTTLPVDLLEIFLEMDLSPLAVAHFWAHYDTVVASGEKSVREAFLESLEDALSITEEQQGGSTGANTAAASGSAVVPVMMVEGVGDDFDDDDASRATASAEAEKPVGDLDSCGGLTELAAGKVDAATRMQRRKYKALPLEPAKSHHPGVARPNRWNRQGQS